jgi:hypothetical protein
MTENRPLAGILVDSNVLLDLLTDDPRWASWSQQQLERLWDQYTIYINPIIYAEISIGFQRIEDLEQALNEATLEMLPLSCEAAFLAGKVFLQYRRAGGARHSPLPDFFIGAQAAVEGLGLLTRDPRHYVGYFPSLTLFAPD